jgi:pimeloyl-ACP methyl ester carboxylesterase
MKAALPERLAGTLRPVRSANPYARNSFCNLDAGFLKIEKTLPGFKGYEEMQGIVPKPTHTANDGRRPEFAPRGQVVTLFRLTLIGLAFIASSGCAFAHGLLGGLGDGPFYDLNRLNTQLHGRVDDYTHNHGRDNRFCSESLGQKRDVYVYVPPGYDPNKAYPMMFWFHGLAQDEKAFLDLVPVFDKGMANGTLPKCIMVSPDGSPNGRASYLDPGTFYLNSKLGKYEDYVMLDVWNFIVKTYSIRPEREAHGLAGASMGGFAAYNLGIKHRQHIGVIVGIMPAINTRYNDCKGNYGTDFDPSCFGLAEAYRPTQPIARFYGGLITVRQRRVVGPVFGEGPDVIKRISAENPAEMLTSLDVKPGELELFAGVGDRDEFNFDAQVDSFEYLAKQRGIGITTVKIPCGKHNKETGFRMLEPFQEWVRPRLEKYAPK